MPFPACVAKAFYFDEVRPSGRPHPPHTWGSRLDFARRFAPPGPVSAPAPPAGITLTLSTTDATLREAGKALTGGGVGSALEGRLPQDLMLTATAEGGDGWTYMLGYDAGASCGFARAAVAAPGSAAAATWFQAGGHVRLEGAADLLGGGGEGVGGETAWCPSPDDDDEDDDGPVTSRRPAWVLTGWGTLTLRDGASQANSTACNLAEREAGFIVSPFTARTSTAAAALRLERRGGSGGVGGSRYTSASYTRPATGGASPPVGPGARSNGGWAVEGSYDFQTCRSYASLEAPVRLPLLKRRLGTLAVRWAAQDGVGLVEFTSGGPPLDGACPPGAAAAAAGLAAGVKPRASSRLLGRLGRVKAFLKADAGPGKAWMGSPAFGVIVDRAM